MAETLEFELVSPERLLVSQPVEMVVVPGTEGDFGALPRHAPMIATVRPGVISMYENDQVSRRVFVAGGFAEVMPERCTVLAEEAVPLDQLSREMVEERLRDAGERLQEADDPVEKARCEARLRIAHAMRDALG